MNTKIGVQKAVWLWGQRSLNHEVMRSDVKQAQ